MLNTRKRLKCHESGTVLFEVEDGGSAVGA